jgi:long-chain acyl-CoA synthetase
MNGGSHRRMLKPNKSWIDLYPEGIEPILHPKFQTALDLFRGAVDEHPYHIALSAPANGLSYSALDQASNALAAWLVESGVRQFDRVAIALQSTTDFPVMILAAWKIGAIPLPLNPAYRPGELANILADAEPSAILMEPDCLASISVAVAQAGLSACALLTTSAQNSEADYIRQVPYLSDILTTHRENRVVEHKPAPSDTALLLYTSGTTGTPKGAMLRHDSLAFNGEMFASWCGLDSGSRILAIAPFFHVTGFVCQIMAGFSARATVIAHGRFEPGGALDVIRRKRPTFAIGAITAFNALMNAPGAQAEDFASFERIYSGGAPIPQALIEQFRVRLGKPIYAAYGMTETSAPTHLSPFGLSVPSDPGSNALSIGIPGPSTDAIIVDDQGREMPIGEAGELLIRGPQVMAGYWRKPEETAAALRGGWMHSGDIAVRDEDGWFYLVDRKKDMIIASGFKVWPREVEDVLYKHPAVREAAVVGMPDSYRGETVKACISLRAGERASEEDIILHCREFLAGYKVPRVVEILPELPKTPTGKIQRNILREMASDASPQ